MPDEAWHHFTSPLTQWARMPSFLVGEYLFYLCALVAFVHAWRSGRGRLLVWLGALVAGTANDLIFMALPLVDNFWQAQATVMLTKRMPLYIPCVYVCFMYYPTVATERLGLRPLARAALTGLLAIVFYAPYDIVGAKFLWWTWHDTDRPIASRLFGAPVGSSMWVITFVAGFCYLLSRVTTRDPALKPRSFALGFALVAGLSTLLMMVQMTILQQLDGGAPGPRGLVVIAILYAAIVVWGVRKRAPAGHTAGPTGKPGPPAGLRPPLGVDRLLHGAALAYFLALVAILALFTPETHVSASMHQTYGPCHVEAKDIVGSIRYEFICAEDFDEDFTFDCVPELPAEGARFYTVCGRPHRDFTAWMAAVSCLGVLGIAAFTFLLRGSRVSMRGPPE